MSEEPREPPIDETRHAQLVQKHVYGDPERRKGGQAPWFRYSSAASVGIEIAVAIVGCTLVAMWIETRFTHWSPWTTLIGFGVGIGAAVKALVRTAKQFQREVAERERLELAQRQEPPSE
ncbi:MAG TPA: AtpZ/AtpI family protein [Enhygromyxa sp.]|nr:AtpZ/AtpI family protein [Enhygromyxa sp.]